MTSMFSKIRNLGERDFSQALTDNLFKVDDLARYGLSGNVTTVAFDPVQSLLAIGTDCGKIHVLGQQNVEVVFGANGRSSIRHLAIIKSIYLVSIDIRERLTVINLDTQEVMSEYQSTSHVTAIEFDPGLDWLFLGLDIGQIMVYDVDRGSTTPFRVGNLQKSVFTKLRMSPVLEMRLHPRDPSLLLVCYTDVVVLYSIMKGDIVFSLRYEVPANAPGGDVDPLAMQQYRFPQLVSAVWHPNGHHILTAHQDGSLVFWDGTEGKLLQARTLMDTDVNIPRRTNQLGVAESGTRSPITKVEWTCTKNPEETSIVVSGGDAFQGARGLTMLDFGPTPEYSITSFEKMRMHYANPRRQKIFPTPEESKVHNFWVVARDNPYYSGNYNPRYLMAMLETGEMLTISYPDGNTVTDPTLLPPALGWITPHIMTLGVSLVPRNQWVGMLTAVKKSDGMFKGGAPAKRHLRSYADRTALCTGHRDGSVRLWDASHGEIEDANVMEVSMSNALRKHSNIAVDKISFAGPVGELAVASSNGQVVLFNFAQNKNRGLSGAMGGMQISDDNPNLLEDIRFRAPDTLKEGFLPQTLVTAQAGRVCALTNSNIGFVGIGYETGEVMIIDKRGPAVIFRSTLAQLHSSGSKRRSRASVNPGRDNATVIEFSIHAIDDEDYSSIVVSIGSAAGKVYTLRILPSQQGGYQVDPVGHLSIAEEPIVALAPVNAANGTSAVADLATMGKLAHGINIPGAIVAVTKSEVRVFKQPNSKVTHKKLAFKCISAGISYLREDDSLALVCLTDTSELKMMTLPGLRDLATRKLPMATDPQFAKYSMVTRNGDVIVRPSLTSGGLVRIWGRGINQEDIPEDALYDVMKPMPPRPTISNIQWLKGRQFTNIEDLDALIGGPRRPKSARQIEEDRARDEQQRLVQARRANTGSSTDNNESEFSDMQRGVDERGKKIGGVQNALDSLEQTSSEYMNSLNGFIKDAKTNALKQSFKSKFLASPFYYYY